jgi:hypothetical protein
MARYLTFAALCLAAWALPARAQPRAAETPGLGEQVRRDLESLFQPGATLDPDIAPYSLPAARARLRTRPYATSIIGICRRDEVIVDYAGPQPHADTVAASAVAPYGVSAESWYRVVRDVRSPSYQGRPREGECATLDGTETRGWFAAPDVYVAAEGYRALAVARAGVEARRSIIGCRESRQARVDCRHTLGMAAGGLFPIIGIARCHAPPRRFCYELGLAEEGSVTIRLRYNDRGEERIESIHIEGPSISI